MSDSAQNPTSLAVEDVPNVLEVLEVAFYDIPFENSAFQTRAFVIASQQTPARAYRAIGLQLFSKIRAVKEYLFQKELNAIDIEEKEAKIEDPSTNDFDRRRLRIEISRIQDMRKWGEKLMNDALAEMEILYSEFKKFPVYTREQFEAEEAVHFDRKLRRQLEPGGGAMESLKNMHEDAPGFESLVSAARQALTLKVPPKL